MSTLPLLEVQGVTKRFGGLLANDAVSFTVKEGEILSIIGPNGAGKSTLFNCITGFYRPNAGRVSYRGKDITRFSADRICKTGIARTFQIVQIISDMTVLENAMTGAFLRSGRNRTAREKAEEVLRFTGLHEKRNAMATALTIADKKRLEVSMALATQPKLLMLDEAMAGLNATETIEAIELIKKIRDRGITLIVVEHVMEVIMSISERVVVFDSGKKIAEDSPDKIVKDPRVIEAYLGGDYHA